MHQYEADLYNGYITHRYCIFAGPFAGCYILFTRYFNMEQIILRTVTYSPAVTRSNKRLNKEPAMHDTQYFYTIQPAMHRVDLENGVWVFVTLGCHVPIDTSFIYTTT